MAPFGSKGKQREPGERARRRSLKKEAKERLRAEGRDQDPLAQKARFRAVVSDLAVIPREDLEQLFEHLEDKSPHWPGELLITRTREAFERLREELEKPSGDVTWKDPFLELRFAVAIDPARGPVADPGPLPLSESDFTDEAWRRFREAAKKEEALEQDPIFQKTWEGLEAFLESSLELTAFRALTGGTALLKDGEEYEPVLLRDPAEGPPEDTNERRAAVEALLEERCKPFVLSGPGEVGLSLRGEADGKPFACSLVAELHPLVLDVGAQEAFYPLLVGLAFEEGDPATWSEEDRRGFWDALFKGLEEVEERLRATTSTTGETGTAIELKPAEVAALAPPVSVPAPLPPPTAKKPSKGTLRRSTMSRVPVSRDFAKDAAGWAFLRGLSGMFSSYSKVPDLDLRGNASAEEAERLFWPILEEHLDKAKSRTKLSSWEKLEEDGKTVIVLRGLQEQDAKSFWTATTQDMTKGAGGDGLDVDPPGFESRNRFDPKSHSVIIETRLVLWPDPPSGRDEELQPHVRFRSEGSPGYVAMLERHGPRPYFADGWLWLPRGGEREGFRLGGLQTLLFPEGRKALERLAEREKGSLEEKLNRIYRSPSLFQSEDARVAQDLRAAIRRVDAWLQKLPVYDVGPDLLLCIYEAFYRQRDAWARESLGLGNGREVGTRPWRIIRLDPEDLRVRLDPGLTWGPNWRARLFEKLEALTTFERQTRTQTGRKVDVGDRFLTRAIDGRRGVQDGAAPETDSGLGLTRLLRQAGAFPMDAFFVEVSVDFMGRLVTWAVDENGLVRWGLDAAQATQRAALVSKPADERGAKLLAAATRREARSKPYYEHSPRLLTVANLQGWRDTRKALAYVVLQEATPNFERYRDTKGTSRKRRKRNRLGGAHALETIDGRDFTACNGSNGYGYKVKTWISKTGYEKRPGPRGGTRAFADFLEDLEGLVHAVDLCPRLEKPKNPPRTGPEALAALRSYATNPPAAYDLKLKLYLPADLEAHLRELLEEAGIDNPDEDEAPPRSGRLDPVDLRLARKRAGLKQAELAARLKVKQPLVSAWEAGKKPIPQDHEERLRRLLGPFLTPAAGGRITSSSPKRPPV